MADNKLVFETEVKGVEQSIESVKDLKNAIRDAKDEQLKMASSFGQGSKQYQDATKKLSELKDKVEDLNDSTKSLKGTGVEQLTQGFSQMKEGLMNLDFDKVKGGIAAMQSGMGAFATAAKGALQGVKGALIATGIGALVVLLGTIVAYWDDIKGAINGVSKEQENLNELTKKNFETEKEKITALNSQDNILKLQGKSEKEILQLKVKQLDATYAAAEAQLNSTILTQQAQEKASQRNRDILSGMLDFVNIPLTLLLKGVDLVGNALGKNFGLAEGFKKSVSDFVLGDDKELAEKNKKELDAQVKTLTELKNQRAGYILAINKIDEDGNNANLENYKKYKDEKLRLQAEEADAWWAERLAEEAQIAKEEEDAKKAEQDEYDRLARLGAAQDEQMKRFTDQSNAREKRKEEEAAKEKELRRKTIEDDLAYTKQGLQATQQITDLFFAYKLNKHKGDAKAELEIRKKQFNVNKAFGITTAVIDGIGAVQKALNNPYPLNIVLAAISGIAAAANVAKIASTKFDGGGAASSGGGSEAPATVPIPTAPTINTPQANTNTSTTFDETGKKIGGESNLTPTIKVNATVGVNEIADKSNRVNVLESQSKF